MEDIEVSPLCAEFLDAVNRPFDYTKCRGIPDGYPMNTVRMVDYYDANPFTLTQNAANVADVSAVGFYFTYGNNGVQSATYIANGASAALTGCAWTWVCFTLGANNVINTVSLTLATDDEKEVMLGDQQFDKIQLTNNKFNQIKQSQIKSNYSPSVGSTVDGVMANTASLFTYGTINYNSITGSGSNNTPNTATSLVTAIRPISVGIRLWPTIEVVTNTSTLYVAQYYGAQVSPLTLNAAITNSSNLITLMKESPDFTQFSNAEGITARFNILQEGLFDPTNMTSVSSLSGTTTITKMDTTNFYFPLIVAQLSASQTWTAGTPLPLPINFAFKANFETVMRYPTPIEGERPLFDPQWKQCLKWMQWRTDRFPIVVSGHSFKKFMVKSIKSIANNAVVRGAVKQIAQSNPITKQLYDVAASGISLTKAIQKRNNDAKNAAQKVAMDNQVVRALAKKRNPTKALQQLQQQAKAANMQMRYYNNYAQNRVNARGNTGDQAKRRKRKPKQIQQRWLPAMNSAIPMNNDSTYDFLGIN